jgi:tetratricopeptide (TPR) repeat protein
LRRLAVFEGGCTLSAAEQVCAGGPVPPADVLDVLGRLVDKSLVQVTRSAGRSRYRLLETVRQLATEHLDRAAESRGLRDAHAAFFRRLAYERDPDVSPDVAVEHPHLLDDEHDNLRAALTHSLATGPDDALALAAALYRFWLARGHYVEGADWLRRALRVAPDQGLLRADALRGLAVLELRLGNLRLATELGQRAATLPGLVSAAEPQVVFARLLAGFISWIGCDLETAAAVAAESAAEATRLRWRELDATAHWLAALTALFREDLGRAEQELTDCLDRLAKVDPGARPFFPGASVCMSPMAVGDGWAPVFEETGLLGHRVAAGQAVGYVQSALGSVHRLALRPAAALAPVRAAAQTFSSLGDVAGRALALNHLGCVERELGDPAAIGHLSEALRLRERIGDRRAATLTLATRGLAEAAAGDPDRGRASVRAALGWLEAIEDRPAGAGVLLDLAVVELVAGETRAARALAESAVELLRPQGYSRLDALVLTLGAELAGRAGDDRAAGQHAEQARGLFGAMACGPGVRRAAAMLAAVAKAR